MPPFVPGFIITSGMSTTATGSQWAAVRSEDGHRVVLKIVPVTDLTKACAFATRQMAAFDQIPSEHLVRQHSAIALGDGTLALVLDEVTGGSLAQLLGARGQLTPGETVTTVAPLFRALADLHAAGITHGDLAPGNIQFSADGRPLIGDLGIAAVLGRRAGSLDGTSGFVATELLHGSEPSPDSDVYAMAALGWFCLTGAPPAPADLRPCLTTLRPETPLRLVKILTACLAADPAARPSADAVAVEVFDATEAESVALALVSDPAAEITRRIRAAAASPVDPKPSGAPSGHQGRLVAGVVAFLVVAMVGFGATSLLRHTPEVVPSVAGQPVAVRQASQLPTPPTTQPATHRTTQPTPPTTQPTAHRTTRPAAPRTTQPTTRLSGLVPAKPSAPSTEVGTARGSPRTAPAGMLQTLVDARALAYVAGNPALLDVVYASGSRAAAVDKSNIATALKNGGTYLGLSFVVKDVSFLDGTSETARIRATVVTPAYQTGQPDGRRMPHAREVLEPCIFSLSLTPDGWRILTLTTP